MVQDEKINGAVVIDLGANITSIGVFLNNKIIFSDSIPIGGLHITSDIVRGLGTKSEDAEKIKILHGSFHRNRRIYKLGYSNNFRSGRNYNSKRYQNQY